MVFNGPEMLFASLLSAGPGNSGELLSLVLLYENGPERRSIWLFTANGPERRFVWLFCANGP